MSGAARIWFFGVVIIFSVTETRGEECKFATCSQYCNAIHGSVNCSCMPGFTLVQGDTRGNGNCLPVDPSWKLVFATGSYVGVISRNMNGMDSLLPPITETGKGRTSGVTYDARNNLVYWTDISENSEAIYRSTLDGNQKEAVVNSGLQLPEGIAFDWITGNVYVVDSDLSYIAVCGNESNNLCSVVLQQNLDKPRGIALHPNQGIMFWTDWGEVPGIMRAGMDGSSPTPIISTDLHWPNGITLDEGNARIYWVEAWMDKVESALFDGSDRQIIVSGKTSLSHPFGVAVFGDTIFWSDWSFRGIQSADKFTGLNVKEHLKDNTTTHIYGIGIAHVASQPILRSNPCANSGCSHICALTSESAFRCLCPAGMILEERSNITCFEPANLPKLVIAFKNNIKLMRFNSIGKNIFETITLPKIHSISDVVYNPINHTIIICDSGRKIYEYNIKRRTLSVIVEEDLETVKGMDIDVVGENLYWLDAGRLTLEVMSFRTGARIKIMTGVSNMIDLVVVPQNRSIFVARMGSKGGKIYKMNMDGGSMSVVQRLGSKEPVALSYDTNSGKILWLDKVNKSIESFSVDDQGNAIESVAVVVPTGRPHDIVTHENQLFWVDPFLQDIGTITFGREQSERLIDFDDYSNSTASIRQIISQVCGRLAVITRNMSSLEDLRELDECSPKNPNKKGCSHLCLLSGDGEIGNCYCPEGYLLDEDGLTCNKPSTCESHQFTCKDGSCIGLGDVCDGTPDCKHYEDEVNCTQLTCAQGGFHCKGSGLCIPETYVCDDDEDCAGGSDELDCNVTTAAPQNFGVEEPEMPSRTTTELGHSITTTTNAVDTPTNLTPTTMTATTTTPTMTQTLPESESGSCKCSETNVLSIIVITVLVGVIVIIVALYVRSVRMRSLSTTPSVLELIKINSNVP